MKKKPAVKKEVKRKLISTVITRTYEVQDKDNKILIEEIQTITPVDSPVVRRMGIYQA